MKLYRKCKICGEVFNTHGRIVNTCSFKCEKIKAERKQELKNATTRICRECGKGFHTNKYHTNKKLCHYCDVKAKSDKIKESMANSKMKVDTTHSQECSKYKQEFIDEHGFLFCESCGKSSALIYSTHHIMPAGRYPKHKELHNKKNKILLCGECHDDFTLERRQDEAEALKKERGLYELFEGGNDAENKD